MALDDIFKGGNIVNGLALAVGAAVLTPIVTPVVRPLAKSLIKAGLLAYDQGRVVVAQLNEHTGDIVAEAREELAHAKTEAAAEADAKAAATG